MSLRAYHKETTKKIEKLIKEHVDEMRSHLPVGWRT